MISILMAIASDMLDALIKFLKSLYFFIALILFLLIMIIVSVISIFFLPFAMIRRMIYGRYDGDEKGFDKMCKYLNKYFPFVEKMFEENNQQHKEYVENMMKELNELNEKSKK